MAPGGFARLHSLAVLASLAGLAADASVTQSRLAALVAAHYSNGFTYDSGSLAMSVAELEGLGLVSWVLVGTRTRWRVTVRTASAHLLVCGARRALPLPSPPPLPPPDGSAGWGGGDSARSTASLTPPSAQARGLQRYEQQREAVPEPPRAAGAASPALPPSLVRLSFQLRRLSSASLTRRALAPSWCARRRERRRRSRLALRAWATAAPPSPTPPPAAAQARTRTRSRPRRATCSTRRRRRRTTSWSAAATLPWRCSPASTACSPAAATRTAW